jgi:hypothetical protein
MEHDKNVCFHQSVPDNISNGLIAVFVIECSKIFASELYH